MLVKLHDGWKVGLVLVWTYEFCFLSVMKICRRDTTIEARRFARLLKRVDGLWELGTVGIIGI